MNINKKSEKNDEFVKAVSRLMFRLVLVFLSICVFLGFLCWFYFMSLQSHCKAAMLSINFILESISYVEHSKI